MLAGMALGRRRGPCQPPGEAGRARLSAQGRFVTAGGVRLHYLDRGSGRPVVFLHGNGAMIEDLLISGVIDIGGSTVPGCGVRPAGLWT